MDLIISVKVFQSGCWAGLGCHEVQYVPRFLARVLERYLDSVGLLQSLHQRNFLDVFDRVTDSNLQ